MRETEISPEVSVIVPARNEEAVLGRCLESLVKQKDPPGQKMAEWGTRVEGTSSHPLANTGREGWGTQGRSGSTLEDPHNQNRVVWGSRTRGISFEVIVVDDHSTDRTGEIGESFPARVVEADVLPQGWTGKSNACWSGARVAKGKWLLFTDADTVHKPNSIVQGILEAEETGAALLSYSPKQEVKGFAERALMPVIFAELATAYQPKKVSDPSSPAAAANGQYLLVRRDVYDSVGGHGSVATTILEDVELARRVKQAGHRLQFRMSDVVKTRMYRSFGEMWEGWTKNLALLFEGPLWLATKRLLEFVLIVLSAVGIGAGVIDRNRIGLAMNGVVVLVVLIFFFQRIRRAHFGWLSNVLSIFGLPLFSVLLVNSYISHKKGRVRWKGRVYAG